MRESYAIRVYKQYFNFGSAHFLIFADGTREHLHGHNYQAQVKVEGALDDGDVVIDFIPFKPLVKALCDSLDHCTLLPRDNPFLEVSEEGDSVVGVGLAQPGDTVLLCTAAGRAIRFDEAAARAMGRTARGVRGIRLKAEDTVVGMVVASSDATVLTATARGYGKRTPLSDYPIKGRGGQGVINIRCSERNGNVVGASLCKEGDDVMYITQSGMIVRTEVGAISTMGRNTQGVRLVNLKADDELVAIEVVSEDDIEKYAMDAAGGGEGAAAPDAASPEAQAGDAPTEPEPEAPEGDE